MTNTSSEKLIRENLPTPSASPIGQQETHIEHKAVQTKQNEEISALKARLKAEYDEGLALAQKTFDEAMQKVETLKRKLKAEQKSLSDQLQMLGFFNFGKKSRIKARLAAIETELTDNDRTPAILRATLNKQEKELCDEYDRKLALGTDAIESRYAVPTHNPVPYQVNSEDIKQIIYSSMQRGKLYTIPEMIDTFPLPADISNQKVTALIRQLLLAEKVEKIVQNRISYFKLNDSTPAGIPDPRYAVPTHNPVPHKVKHIEHDRKTTLQQQWTADSIRAIILENMRPGQLYTISQIQETFPLPANTSVQQVTFYVRELLLAELVERIIERRISYFKLNDSTPAGRPNPRYAVPTHNPVPHQVNESEDIKQIIYNSMQRGKLYTIQEMIDTFPLPADISNQKVTALTRQLYLAEKVEKIVQNRRSYFRKP